MGREGQKKFSIYHFLFFICHLEIVNCQDASRKPSLVLGALNLGR